MTRRNARRPKPVLWPELRAWLADTGTSQSELAVLVGVSHSQVSRVLGGYRCFSPAAALRIAEVTGIPIEHLVNVKTVRMMQLMNYAQARQRSRVSSIQGDV